MTSFIRNRENLQWGRNGKGSGDTDDRHFVQQPSTSLQASPPVPALAQPSEDPLARTLLAAVELTSRTLIEHPCRVLRRQCQVHQFARSLHLTPVTLVPVIFNITSKEGLLTLWKGSIGTGVLWGLTSVTEIVFSDLFGLPRTFVPGGSTEKFWRHILLKAVAALTTTPFYISSFIETVRSESGLGGDDNRVMEVLVKGVDRMRFFAFGARDSSRRFSVLHLAIPTVTFRTSHYLIQTFLYEQLYRIARRYVNRKPESERTRYHQYVPQIFATMTSSISTDLILFPFETIIHRMYIQGTRTLIDNLDNGLSAASITIKYNGFFDCFRQTVNKEGFWALYSGVGALCLEYLLHSALHQVLRLCFDRGSEALRRAAAAHHLATTPPLSHATSNLDQMGPLSGPLASQVAMPHEYEEDEYPATSPQHLPSSVPVITSPPLIASPPMRRRPPPQAQAPPPPRRDPMSFPSFGETTSSFGGMDSGSSFGNPPFQPPKSSIFGSARSLTPSSSAVWDPLPPLKMDANDPFSG